MRSFDFEKEYSKLLTPDIVSYIAQIMNIEAGIPQTMYKGITVRTAGDCQNTKYGSV